MKKPFKFLSTLFFITFCCFPSVAVDKDELVGEGTPEHPYIIEDGFDFVILRQWMEKREFYTEGKYFLLTRDIAFNGNVLSEDGNLTSDSLALQTWTPIGWDAYGRGFYGIFDGGGHTVSGIYINDATAKNSGFFGYISKQGDVRNLKIADSYICGGEATGGIVGLCDGKVTDCESTATVKGVGSTHQSGGIAGMVSSDGTIKKCKNSGKVLGVTYSDEWGYVWNCSTGGVVGSASARVDSCLNVGTVMSYGWGEVGGIAGGISSSSISNSVNEGLVSSDFDANIGGIVGGNSSSVWGCRNKGEVRGLASGSCIGGIAGSNNFNSRISDSENYADIVCDVDSVFVGGIVGRLNGGRSYNTYYTPMVYTSVNHGSVSTGSVKSQCGGIAGKSYCGEMHGCENHGHILSNAMAGGILPLGEFHTHIYDSFNSGRVEGLKSTGGIVGKINGEVCNSRNSGLVSTINGDTDCGGIVGWLDGSSGIVRNCVNTGEVMAGKNIGGIVGDNTFQSTIITSYNAGYVHSSTPEAKMGGVAGGSGNLRNCYNAGTVHAEAPGIKIGGVIHNLWMRGDSHGNFSGGSARNCFNVGDIIVDSADCTVGNIAAVYEHNDAYLLFKNCYYLKDAVYGVVEAVADMKNNYCVGLGRDDFRTLVQDLNKVDYPWDPMPFVQGYWHPLLNKDGMTDGVTEPMGYYEVLTLEGDSALIDLGLPLGNVFFRTDSLGEATNAYNVAYGDSVKRVRLVDGADFNLDRSFAIGELSYLRHVSSGYNASCLPVEINCAELPSGSGMFGQPCVKADSLMIVGMENAKPGVPFMFDGGQAGGKWYFRKEAVSLAPVQPVDDPMLKGTFSLRRDFPAESYLLADDGAYMRRVEPGDSLPAFRAYLETVDCGYDRLGITVDGGSESGITDIISGCPVISAHGLSIEVSGLDSPAELTVCDLQGRIVHQSVCTVGTTNVRLQAQGLYIVRLGMTVKKLMLR